MSGGSGASTGTGAKEGTVTVSRDVLLAGQLAIKQAQEKQSVLVAAKDRGQITATTAMLVVDIALLRNIIDAGPERHSFYSVSLGLIGLSIFLQLVAGLVSLLISNVTSYYEKYRDDALQDFCINICHCKFEWTHSEHQHPDANRQGRGGGGGGTENEVTIEAVQPKVEEKRCCPCRITTRVHEDFEYHVYDEHEKMMRRLVDTEMTSVTSTEQVAHLDNIISEAKTRQTSLEAMANNPKMDMDFINEQLRKVTQEIENAEGTKKEHEEKLRGVNIEREKSKVLYEYASAIKKNRTLKRISFWQHFINYVLYFVFLTNAFITGLGIAERSSYGGASSPAPPLNTTSA